MLAYGQTGSGKTYTMGTCSVGEIDEEDVGVIPVICPSLTTIVCRVEARPPSLRGL